MPQKRISICMSRSVGSRRGILLDANPDVALAAEYAFALYVVGCMVGLSLSIKNRIDRFSHAEFIDHDHLKVAARVRDFVVPR